MSNSSTGVHNITRALAEHNGTYVCVPYNEFGPGERAALNVTFVGQLHVNEKIYKQYPLCDSKIFVRRDYLFREANSLPRAIRNSRKTVSFEESIMSTNKHLSIFSGKLRLLSL